MRAVAVLVLLVGSVALLAWLTLHWGILPRIGQWKPQIEQRASAAIGQTVRIGDIRVRSGGWIPALDLADVRVLDAAGRIALALGEVRVALAPHSLLTLQPRLAQLHVEGVELDVRRDAAGRIRVAGLDLQAGSAGDDDGAAADWLFSQHEVVIRHGRVRWTDELRAAPPLALTEVDLVIRNGLRRHDLRLDAKPPPGWGERFSLRGKFTQALLARRGDWRRWSGTAYAELPAFDVARLKPHVDLPIALDSGRGALRSWLELRNGRWREATADVALSEVALRLAEDLAPLAVADLSTRLRARRDAEGIEVAAERLAFTTAEGVNWPAGDLTLAWTQAQDLSPPVRVVGPAASAALVPAPAVPVTGGRLRASRLDLAVMAGIAARLPLPPAARQTLGELAPAGVARALDLSWKGAFEGPMSYRARGQIDGLALAPRPHADPGSIGRPGLAGAAIEFEATEAGGQARLAIQAGQLIFPGVFEQPAIALDSLAARLAWRIQPRPGRGPAVELRVTEARFENDDAQGDLQATWRTGAGADFGPGGYLPGEIDLSGRIQRARADRVAAYLPLGLPPMARRYVDRAIEGGTLQGGSFAVKGDVWKFPYAGLNQGTFRVAAKLRGARFDYLPSVPAGGDEPAWDSPWPGFTDVEGDIVFDRTALRLEGVQARLWGVQLRRVQARIDDLAAAQPLLQVDGEARGPASDLLRFVGETPVGRWVGSGLTRLTATGTADLRLALNIPLADGARTRVRGSVTLAGNDVRVSPDTPLLAQARGRVDFTERGFAVVGGQARVLGGDASIEGGSQPDGSLRFTGQGTVTAEALRQATELGLLPAIAARWRGQAAVRVNLGFVDGWPELSVGSDLVGLQSDWPAPLNKPAATAWPMRWSSTMLPGSLQPGQTPRDLVRLDVAHVLQARLQREWAADGVQVRGGAIGVLEAAPPLPPQGVLVRMSASTFDADAWVRAAPSGPAGAAVDALVLPPAQVQLRADHLVLGERRLDDVVLDLRHQPALAEAPWSGNVEAAQLAGRIAWRPPAGPADPGRLTGRFSRLVLPPSDSVDVEQLLDRAPARMPALDIVVDDFAWRGRTLGRLELQAINRPSAARAGAREWRLDRLDLALPEARLTGSGTWAPPVLPGAPRRMNLDFAVDLADSGRLATRFGWTEAVRGGKGRLSGQLAWDGSPMAPDFPSMDGRVNLALESGQFLRAEPGGIGRLLGILSLQALPRRLLLDFRDVFQEGFAFDNVNGDVAVARGRATTSNLRMRGVQAVVLMEGSADLIRETQDLNVLIVPEVNAGAASLAYAAINPAVALGSFLAQLVLREPLRAAGTREFRITGPMNEPRVERVDRLAQAASSPAPTSPTPPSATASAPLPSEPRRSLPPTPPAHRSHPPGEPRMKIAAVQMVSTPDVERNLQAMARLVAAAAAQGARIVGLPEYFCLMGARDTDKLVHAEQPGQGPIQAALAAAAHRHRLWLVGGTLPMRVAGRDDRVRNTTLVFGPDGQVAARYDKIHLFAFDNGRERYDEGRVLEAGAEPVSFVAEGHRVGLSVCYDLRFPELYRALAFGGDTPCDLMCVPSAFTHTTGQAHWELLMRARAVENQCYVLAPAQGGTHENGRRTWGHTMIVDPWGQVLARCDEGEGVVVAELDAARLAQVRQQLPALQHRRL